MYALGSLSHQRSSTQSSILHIQNSDLSVRSVRSAQDVCLSLLVINGISIDTSRLRYEQEGHNRAQQVAGEEDPEDLWYVKH